ncbi:MAG: RidA family protein [Thermoanaerobaculia bacterium]
MNEKLQTVSVPGAPKAIGPYAQAVKVGNLLYTAGQIPLDPATMKLVEGDITVQTARVFDNLEAILRGAGATLANVVKTSVFLADLRDFAAMNEVYAARFGAHRPARSTMQVAALPAGARIEIELVAAL